MNAKRVKENFDRVEALIKRGEKYHSAHQWKLLKKARAKWNKKLQEFTNPNAPARPLPARLVKSQRPIQLSL